jgi:hypothetical protein
MTVALSIDVLAAARSSIMSDQPCHSDGEAAVAAVPATPVESECSTSPAGSSASFATYTTVVTDTDSVAPSVRAEALSLYPNSNRRVEDPSQHCCGWWERSNHAGRCHEGDGFESNVRV